ncbi:tripartite tricarboxylate transporter permease [Corynebacterium sp.]|uniref:tripartite tricarboxylate transporter permease n=1 Tax=Corynebacterium sp. TaxID=1720 RepID=UPI0028AA61F1|nr:tripartite tricarboxylate transporter permease [Corynebacterium sp.]
MSNWMDGLSAVADFQVVIMLVLGVLIGMVVGALPGISATVGVALLLPFTFALEPLAGMMLLLGIYGGAVYAGSIPAILIRTPGTPASAATVADGHAMAMAGKGVQALKISVLASCIGGFIGVLLLAFFSPVIADFALGFGSSANFMLALFALTIIASISEGRMVKGLIAGFLGLGIAMIGLDTIQGFPRLTFGNADLISGISFIPLMIGLFAVSEAFLQVERLTKLNLKMKPEKFRASPSWFRKLMPSSLLGSAIGFVIGIIPGVGGDISSFVAYNESKRASKDKSQYGKGDPRGIAAAESSKNAGTAGALVPTLTLGIPGDVTSAVLIGALTVHGLQPGPTLFSGSPDLIYGLFIGFALVYLVLLVLGWFGTSFWVKLIESVPPRLLWPSVIVLAVVGSYAMRSSIFDVLVMFLAAILGYIMVKGGFPLAPLIIGVILGPIAESGFRRAMIINDGSFRWMLEPIPLVLGILTLASIGFAIWQAVRRPKLIDKADQLNQADEQNSDPAAEHNDVRDDHPDDDSVDATAAPTSTDDEKGTQ